jgi:hypothetical protein
MDRELESLLLAYDAWLQAGEDDLDRCEAVFEGLVGDILSARPNLSREQLLKALRSYYPRWIRAQQHPPTLPPQA